MNHTKQYKAAVQFGQTLVRNHGHKGYMLREFSQRNPVGKERISVECHVQIFEFSLLLDEMRSLVKVCDKHGVDTIFITEESGLKIAFL
jgi:hypothetical protein